MSQERSSCSAHLVRFSAARCTLIERPRRTGSRGKRRWQADPVGSRRLYRHGRLYYVRYLTPSFFLHALRFSAWVTCYRCHPVGGEPQEVQFVSSLALQSLSVAYS